MFNAIEQKIRSNGMLYPLDILFVGATGVGKSSTINFLLGQKMAEVGESFDPCTQKVSDYSTHKYLRVHDSAGLGESTYADTQHSKAIIDLLTTTITAEDKLNGFIDMVLVVLDAKSRDLGSSLRLLTETILPNISKERVIVAINQADLAMSGRYFDYGRNQPESVLLNYLEEQANSVQSRLKENGIQIAKPIYYSAKHGYNLEALGNYFVKQMPTTRRLIENEVQAIKRYA